MGVLSGLISKIGGDAAVSSLSSAVENIGWKPKSYEAGMNFDTNLVAGEEGGVPSGSGESQWGAIDMKADVGSAPAAPIASAPGISAGSFGGQSMLGDVSMNAGLNGMLGAKAIDTIAASANKFKANPVAQVPGIRI